MFYNAIDKPFAKYEKTKNGELLEIVFFLHLLLRCNIS